MFWYYAFTFLMKDTVLANAYLVANVAVYPAAKANPNVTTVVKSACIVKLLKISNDKGRTLVITPAISALKLSIDILLPCDVYVCKNRNNAPKKIAPRTII